MTAIYQDPRIVVKTDSRIPALDGLRGVASLMVLSYHFGPHIVRDLNSPFYLLHWIPPFWFEGVDLFFVLSGFLIAGILMSVRQSPNYFKTFYLRRLFRIAPLYYAVLIGYGIANMFVHGNTCGRLFENPLPIWTYALFVQNIAMATANSFGPIWMAGTWSVAVEEQFYLALPGLIRRTTDQGLGRFALAGVACSPILRALIQKYRFASPMANYVLLSSRLDSLAVGILVMLMLRWWPNWLTVHQRAITWGTVVLFIGWTAYPYIPNSQAIRLAFINHTITALICGAILLCLRLVPLSVPGRFLSTEVMRTLGNMAYSTYLLHPIVLCLVFAVWRKNDPALLDWFDLAPLGAATLITFGLSWLSWAHFERPMLRIGHGFRY